MAVEVPKVAVIVTGVDTVTALVVRLAVTVAAPESTFTDAGTTTSALELLRVTTDPAGPALPFKVMVRVVAFPPTTGFGLAAIAESTAGVKVSVV